MGPIFGATTALYAPKLRKRLVVVYQFLNKAGRALWIVGPDVVANPDQIEHGGISDDNVHAYA
jgi:hypothetical protein